MPCLVPLSLPSRCHHRFIAHGFWILDSGFWTLDWGSFVSILLSSCESVGGVMRWWWTSWGGRRCSYLSLDWDDNMNRWSFKTASPHTISSHHPMLFHPTWIICRSPSTLFLRQVSRLSYLLGFPNDDPLQWYDGPDVWWRQRWWCCCLADHLTEPIQCNNSNPRTNPRISKHPVHPLLRKVVHRNAKWHHIKQLLNFDCACGWSSSFVCSFGTFYYYYYWGF